MKKRLAKLLDELDEKSEQELPSEARMDKAVKLYEFLFTWGILLLVFGGIAFLLAEVFLGFSIPLWGYVVGPAVLAYWLLRHQKWWRF